MLNAADCYKGDIGSEFYVDPRPEESRPAGVLLVSPNSRLHIELRSKLRLPLWELFEAGSGAEAMEYLYENSIAILLLDPLLPDLLSSEFSEMVRQRFPSVQVLSINCPTGQLVVGSGSPTSLSARLADQLCSGDEAPPGRLSPIQQHRMRNHTETRGGLSGMVGESDAMQRVYEMARLVAHRDTTVLITGESGTGKDVIAQAIHLMSSRAKQPLVVINCALGHAGAQASIDALRAGAVEILCKPNGPCSIGELGVTLSEKIRTAAAARVRIRSKQETALAAKPSPRDAEAFNPIQFAADKIIAIGASTGGPGAVAEVLAALPSNCPPVLIVQHMPAGFTTHFAARLKQECRLDVKEAVDGDLVIPGRALVAPGNFHMTLKQSAQGYYVKVGEGPPVCFSRPSVDVLFSSVAGIARKKAVGVLLTGMGADGARGLLEMRKCGAITIAQNEDTCVVFGMPREAIRLEAATLVLPLNQIAAAIVCQISQPAPQLAMAKAS